MMSFDPSLVRYTEAQSQQFFEQVAERARAVPGVTTVTMTTSVPMSNDSIGCRDDRAGGVSVPGRQGQRHGPVVERRRTLFRHDGDHDSRRGGTSGVDDDLDAPRVAIVNQQFAQHYWPNQDPIGKRFRLVDDDKSWVQIVGAGEDQPSTSSSPSRRPSSCICRTGRRQPQRMVMLAQSAGDPRSLAGPLREVVRSLDANLPIYNVRTMEALYRMRAISIFNVLVTMVGAMG